MASSSQEKIHDSSSLEKYDDEKGPVQDLAEVVDFVEDPNFDPTALQLEDESPYPEVRSAVANTDDPDMPCATLRAWILGIVWAIIIPGVNQFFFFRFPAVTISSLVPQLLSFPVVKLWARFMPRVKIFGLSLNPGPFTIKEHVIITVMASVGAGSAYATDIVAVQRVFYGRTTNFGYQWMLVMSTQLIGFSIGGICRRFLVSPPSMIWPSNLVSAVLFNTLHARQTAGTDARGGISRERFFAYVCAAYFVWNFIPSYLFTALSSFAWVTWIRPNDLKINQLFGTNHGLAFSMLTLDWGQITFVGSPLPVPWWAIANIGISMVIFYWVLTPILYYKNIWFSAYLPIVSSNSFDNTGKHYNVTRIINEDLSLNVAEYEAYSPLFLPAAFAVSYGLSFASITATLTHCFLYYRKQIWVQSRRALSEQPDVHARLMAAYKGVPEWWYAIIFVSMFVFGVIIVEVFHPDFPVWAFALALAISFVYTIPIGIIQAITNMQVGLNVITELIIGYMLPGRPIAMMMFKTWGYITMAQALTFTSDFKLGHYMKIPPRQMFYCQVVATIIAGTVQLGVQAWMFTNIPDMCSPDQTSGFICPNTTVFGTASIIWGVIGPARQFSRGQMFYGLVFFFIAGSVAPIIQWAVHKRFKLNILKYLNFPVIFSGPGLIPPATPLNYIPWVLIGFIFNYMIRRRNFGWWSKYNYVLSAGLDSGYAIGTLFVFFVLQFPANGSIGANTINAWWGNSGAFETADVAGLPLLTAPEGQKFGPTTW